MTISPMKCLLTHVLYKDVKGYYRQNVHRLFCLHRGQSNGSGAPADWSGGKLELVMARLGAGHWDVLDDTTKGKQYNPANV